MYCPACGHDNLSEAEFCGNCGVRLAAGQPTPYRPFDRLGDAPTARLGPRTLGEILSDTFEIYRRNFWKLMAIVAIEYVVLLILFLIFVGILFALQSDGGTFVLSVVIIIAILMFATIFVTFLLVQGAVIHAVSEQNIRRPIRIGRAYAFSLEKLGAMLGAAILAGLAVVAMAITIIGIPFAVYFGVRWSFILPAALLEDYSPGAALSRSSELVQDNWWRVLGILLVVGIVVATINIILAFLPVLGTLASILTTPVFFIAHTLLYYDLRVRREGQSGFTLETLARELRIQTDGTPASQV